MFCGAIWSKAVGMVIKFCFTDWLQDLQDTLLHDAVYNGWDSKGAGFPVWFWDFHPADRAGVIALKLLLNQRHIFFLVQFGKVLYGALIYSCGTAPCVSFDCPICHSNIFLTGNEFHKVNKHFAF